MFDSISWLYYNTKRHFFQVRAVAFAQTFAQIWVANLGGQQCSISLMYILQTQKYKSIPVDKNVV